MKTTTIFEIAKVLKISPSTVSRALKNHPDIHPQTKAKVLEVAKTLDYEPNLFAVSLRKDNSKEIAIIAPSLSGFYYDSFISAVEIEAKKLGYSIIILLSGDDAKVEIQNLKTCKQRRVAGIMICVTSQTIDQEIFNSLHSFNMPVIFFDKVLKFDNTVMVCSDDDAAASLAANALLDRKRKRILSIFGDENFSITKKRMQAYIKTFEDSKIKNEISVVHASNSSNAEQLLFNAFSATNKPDAVFCMSDEILIGAMKAIQVLKLSVPSEVSIIAISNGFFPKLYSPEITYVETSGFKLGELAMKSFIKQVSNRSESGTVMLEPILVWGGSL